MFAHVKLASLVVLAAALASPALAQVPDIDTLAIRSHTRFLADDLLAGRATGAVGADIAALYIETQCRALGLESVGDGFQQPVPLEEARVLPATRLAARDVRGTIELRHTADFVPNVGSRRTLRGFEGRAVFVGSEEMVATGGLNGIELDRMVAVTVGPFRGPAADTLVARGAVGMLHLITDPASYDLYRKSRGSTRLYHRDASVQSSFLPDLPSVLVGARGAAALLASATATPDGSIAPQFLQTIVHYEPVLDRRSVHANNVACLLRGSHPLEADTAIVLTAHYDHLGISEPNTLGDSIYNGFSDNAAGVAMVLAIAQELTRPAAPPVRHSVVFLFLTGEERGLLGSDFYVAEPVWPLGRTAAVINLDAGAPPGAPTSWRLAGADTTGLGAIAVQTATRAGWHVTTSPARPNSDYFPFHREGVPAVFIIPGPEPYEGMDADSSKALRSQWDHYHGAGDHWSEAFPFLGLARYAAFALMVLRAVDGPA